MTVDFTRPVTSDLRAAVLQELRGSIVGLSRMLDGETLIGTPTGAIRYNAGAVTGPSGNFTALAVAGNAVWHAGNFAPASYLGGNATARRASALTTIDPGLGAGDAWVGVAAPSITANGNAAALITRDHNDANRWFHLYVTSGVFRIWDSYSSDRLMLDSAGNLTAVGNITAFSDRRLKEFLSPLDMALGDIASLQSYEFRRTDTGSWEVGVMAQDVRAIPPFAVMQDERGMPSLAREVKRIKQQLDGTRLCQ